MMADTTCPAPPSAPAPPRGITTREALAKKHAGEASYLEAKLAAAARPRLGRPVVVASAGVHLQAAAERAELARVHAGEVAALNAWLEASAIEAAVAATAAAAAAAATAPAPAAAAAAPTAGAAAATSTTVAASARCEPSCITSSGSGVPAASTSAAGVVAPAAAAGGGGGGGGGGGDSKLSRAQRKREKKRAEEAAEAAATAARGEVKSSREIEMEQLQRQLYPLDMDVRLIPADGHCMFRAVADQLAVAAAGAAVATPDAPTLRRRAAEYIASHAAAFAPFLPYDAADGYPEVDAPPPAAVRAAVERYTTRLAGTAQWGGHPELRALASTLGRPIVIFQAGAAPWQMAPDADTMLPSSAAGGDAALPPLRLSYHKYYYGLGEHYNSVVPRAAPSARGVGSSDLP